MQRIYRENFDGNNEQFSLTDKDTIHQLVKVLRIKQGENISFFNGVDKKDYLFEIDQIEKKEITFIKKGEKNNNSEIDFSLSLYNGLPNKLEKIEYIIQKGTEIGITDFHFFRSERSQKLTISDNKLTRLKRIIIEASEQSGRSIVPNLHILDQYNLDEITPGKNIFFHTKSDNSQDLKNINTKQNESISLFVGPEGGWSESEVKQLEKIGERVHLGDRILRTETTGLTTAFYFIHR